MPYRYDLPNHPLIPVKTHQSISADNDTISQYISNCKTNLSNCNRQNHKRNNLTNRERQILNKLKNRKDIIIKKADKGDTIVVETVQNYITDGLAHLENSKYYHRLETDLNPTIENAITKFLINAHQRGFIDKDTYLYLLPPKPSRTPLIYFLKKLHKSPISVRPIVSHVNSVTSNISAFIDHLLKPIVKEIPHILSNSTELLLDLKSIPCCSNTILVSLDVVSLYPNIPIEESIHIILNIIKEQNNPTYPPLCILNTLLSFVLNYNCFNFGDLFFLQVHGIAMGTRLAPNYANLFMSDFESKHVFTQSPQPVYYRRYIDDIFMVWHDSPEELNHFVDHMNSVHPTIKFTKTVSNDEITYLDLDIYLQSNTIQTKTHFKTTNTFTYLHGKSNHPPSTFKGVTKGENIRILRNTSDENTYLNTMDFINNQFKRRRYPSRLTTNPPINFSERDSLFLTNNSSSSRCPTFITTFDPSVPVRDIIHDDWPRISSNPELRKFFLNPPAVSYKHSPNLSQLLTRAKLDHTIDTNIASFEAPQIHSISYPSKNIKCRHSQCGTCSQLSERGYYSSYQTKIYYQIPDIYSCNSHHVIYLLECKVCQKQYVGETHTTIRQRMLHHRNMSKTATNRPLYSHILNHRATFEIYSLTIIDQVMNLIERKSKETYYIKLLKTKVPFGFNVLSKKS